MTNTSFEGGNIAWNKAGGAIAMGDGLLTINSCAFRNTADGSAIRKNGGQINIYDTTFDGNAADASGGALCIHGGSVYVSDSIFTRNGNGHSGGTSLM